MAGDFIPVIHREGLHLSGKAQRHHPGKGAQGVRIADFAPCDHLPQFGGGKGAAAEDGLAGIVGGTARTGHDGTSQEQMAVFIGKTGAGEKVAERKELTAAMQTIETLMSRP